MISETFVASDPKGAYEQAVEKYGTSIKLLSAKQVKQDDGQICSSRNKSVLALYLVTVR